MSAGIRRKTGMATAMVHHLAAGNKRTNYSRAGISSYLLQEKYTFIPEREEKHLTFAESMVYYSRTVTNTGILA